MFQSRITQHQIEEYITLLDTDPTAAANYKIRFDRTDQWFLEEIKASHDTNNPGISPKVPWTDSKVEYQIETDLANGKFKPAK